MDNFAIPTLGDLERIKEKARDYAKRSYEFTHDYRGWETTSEEDKKKKLIRIAIGKTGQLWLKRVCEINWIPFVDDLSDYKTPDNYDVIIYGRSFDTKTTKNGLIPCQVNAALREKEIDYYCFLAYYSEPCRIEPYGVISSDAFWEKSEFVGHGEFLPRTGFKNKYRNGSSVLTDLSQLEKLEDVLVRLRNEALLDSLRSDIEKMVKRMVAEQFQQFYGRVTTQSLSPNPLPAPLRAESVG